MRINSKNKGFVEGTLVLMANGSQKPIEQIKTGDMVLSFDEYDADAPLEAMKVINTFSRIDNEILEVKVGENTLKVAKDQMFIGPHNDWKEVYNHSLIVDVNGHPKEYEVSRIGRGKHKVYDITVNENHSLIANGLRVHNGIETSGPGSTGGVKSGTTTGSSMSGGGSMGGSGRATSGGLGGFGSGTGGTSGAYGKQTGSGSTAKTSQTKTGGGNKSPSGSPNAGKTSSQSANNSMGGGNKGNGGLGNGSSTGRAGGGAGGQNNGVGNSNQKVNNGKNGYKKKSNKAKDEPDIVKPNGASVAIKLLETVDNNVDVLQGIVNAYTPSQLTSTKPNIQAGVDSIYSFTNSYVAAIYASELNVYDKTELIQIATQIMSTASELRNPFEETVVTAEGKKMATIYLDLIEANVMLSLEKLGAEIHGDSSGNLSVTVDGETNSTRSKRTYTKKSYSKPRKESNGKYTTAKKKANRKIRAGTRSSAPARNIYEV